MLVVVVATAVLVMVGAAVLAYVAYPHRGRDLPLAPKVGRMVRGWADRIPRVDESEQPLIRRH